MSVTITSMSLPLSASHSQSGDSVLGLRDLIAARGKGRPQQRTHTCAVVPRSEHE